jgi:hypothetical protein
MIEAKNYAAYEQSEIIRSQEQLNEHIMNPGWDDLVAPFNVELDQNDPRKRAEQIDAVSEENWDFRGQAAKANGNKPVERHHLNWEEGELADPHSEVGQQIMAGGDKLNMILTEKAPEGYYDWAVLLGGGNDSILQRAEHLLNQDDVSFGRMAILASTRELNDAEKKVVTAYAPEAKTEADVANAVVRHLMAKNGRKFTLSRIGYEAQEGHIGTVDAYQTDSGKVYVLCAPAPKDEDRRANTTDTYRLFRTFAKNHLDENTRVLVSTNAIYQFQKVDAEKELTDITGLQVIMTTFSAESVGLVRRPNAILQEARSYMNSIKKRQEAINSRRMLLEADIDFAGGDYATAAVQEVQSVLSQGGNLNKSMAELVAAQHGDKPERDDIVDRERYEDYKRAQLLGGLPVAKQTTGYVAPPRETWEYDD